MTRFVALTAAIGLGTVLLAAAGCGSGNDKATVEGTVSTKGTNLNWGRIHFLNAKGTEVGMFPLKNDGTFIATDLPMEELKVYVEVEDSSKATPAMKVPAGTTPIPDANPRPQQVVKVPEAYTKAATTTASVKVTAPRQKVEIKLD